MNINYQGTATATDAATVAAFLAERKIPAASVVLELNGAIHTKSAEWDALPLTDGDELYIFRIVAGG